MTFLNVDVALSPSDIEQVEVQLGIKLPPPMHSHYLRWNGGSPEPYVFEDAVIDTVVSEMLPLKSGSNRETASQAYKKLVLDNQLMRMHFFPFAVDGGGDYFFADCSDPSAPVHFFRGDYWGSNRGKCDVNLSLTFEAFWRSLKPE